MEMLTPSETLERIDALQRNLNDVLVQTSKAFKAAAKGSQSSPGNVSAAFRFGADQSYNHFNYAVDDLESQIIRAKAVLFRDLNELRAKRMPPPTPPPEPVAPPAPMDMHMEPLTSFDATTSAVQHTLQGAGRPVKQEDQPVAPFPNMGFDFSVSPESAKAPSPALSQAKTKSMKASSKVSPQLKGVQAVRPSSVPPKKEPRATVSPQLSRTAAPTPQPAPAMIPAALPAPMHTPLANPPPSSLPSTTPGPALTPAPAPQPEMVFTDMAFSVDDSQGAGPMSMADQTPQQQQQAFDSMVDLTQFADFGAPDANMINLTEAAGPPGGMNSNGADTNTNNVNDDNITMSNVDADIDNLLNSAGPGSAEKLDMDYELGNIGLDNNSFDDMFFDNASGGEAEFGGDSYYGIQ